jgi:hypothetical protein
MIAVQNAGFVLINLAVGRANDLRAASAANPGGYQPGMWIFTGIAGTGVVLALWLARVGVRQRVWTRPTTLEETQGTRHKLARPARDPWLCQASTTQW